MIDIYSKGMWPGCELSNFANHEFELDGIRIVSMEGFLQSLKMGPNIEKQRKVCLLGGKEAKMAGRYKIRWRVLKTVYWNGRKYHLLSDDLQLLIDRAYYEMFKQNNEFRKALFASSSEELRHSIGKRRSDKTILTEYNFVRRLENLRLLMNS